METVEHYRWYDPTDDFWFTQAVALEVAADKARQTGERQRVERCDPESNPYLCTWQIVPVTP